ncbi:acyl-CoA dehydrogenase family protein [Pseudonocardia alni]|uniref:Alkylation response protein AidB-like acyl-CoA dehydrogenase n=1 Tax=Pseudonocardia alni TaxID=33907 RepID=A0A852WEW3_PSEA5|nr:acyl-CoA dehydrogenase family protein [Pseudonocardia antarctica]NYG05244.1 alkylation response protein AidB-like acyl-CoA dehydrogenase [Pseudonocardia antarctica]
MRLTPDEDAEELRGVVRAFLDRHCTAGPDDGPGWATATWARFATELGAVALDLPEEHGGAGATFREMAVVAEELGRSVTRLPWLGTSVLAVGALRELDAQDLLQRLLTGEATGTLAVGAEVVAADGRLSGEAPLVVDGASADIVLVPAGGALYAVEDGAVRERLRTMDPTRELAHVRFDDCPARLLSTDAASLVARVRHRAEAALAAEQAGGAAAALDMAVAHAGTRLQFGRPIGSFQAIKHRCAEMMVRVEAARSAALWAAAAVSDGSPQTDLAVATAGAVCGEAYTWVAAENVQVHGGIGFTWEHPAHLHVRRAATSAVLFGDRHRRHERVLELVGVGS